MKMCVCMLAVIWFLSLRFNSHFPGGPGLDGVYWSKGWWRWQLDHRSHKSCKAPVRSSPLTSSFLQAWCHSCRPNYSVKALREKIFDFRKTHSFFLVTLYCEEVATEIQQPHNWVIIEHKAKNEHWLGVTRWWANNIKWNDVTRHNLELLLLFLFNSHFPRQPG